jgi:N-acetyl-gamma-glutamyl-phosphate reductase
MKKIKVAVFGATGFTGEKLIELLLSHPYVEITYLCSRTEKEISFTEIFPRFLKKTDLKCQPLDLKKAIKSCEVFFLSLPHTISMRYVPFLLKNDKKVIDLSADYRIKNPSLYKKYYKISHKDKKNLKKAVYGLGEIFKEKIKNAQLVANPGCYATTIILALYPLLKEGIIKSSVFVDSKSSITGAGRKPYLEFHYTNISNNLWAYKPFLHQHLPEILEVLEEATDKKVKIGFVPHVVGVEAGIYSTFYVEFEEKISLSFLDKIYKKYYKNYPFIRIHRNLPKLKDVIGTNFCDLGFALDEEKKQAVIVSCLDNLIKGAAGNAIQSLNIMYGLKETEGLL